MPKRLLTPSQQQKRYIISASKRPSKITLNLKRIWKKIWSMNSLQVIVQALGLLTLIALIIMVLPFLTLIAMLMWKVGVVVLILALGIAIAMMSPL